MAMISVYSQNLSLFLTDLAYFRQNSSYKCKNSSQSQKTQGFSKNKLKVPEDFPYLILQKTVKKKAWPKAYPVLESLEGKSGTFIWNSSYQ